jgi:hypothetical protein
MYQVVVAAPMLSPDLHAEVRSCKGGAVPFTTFPRSTMSTDPKHEIEIDGAESFTAEAFDDEFETIGDYHRKAAHYFSQAAKHHLAAAAADDEGDETATELNAFKAYRDQLNGVQCAEIAAMESGDKADSSDGLDEEEGADL